MRKRRMERFDLLKAEDVFRWAEYVKVYDERYFYVWRGGLTINIFIRLNDGEFDEVDMFTIGNYSNYELQEMSHSDVISIIDNKMESHWLST